MKWQVAIQKTMRGSARTFELDIQFASDAARLVLFGPSGAGKSLTLKAIAGLLTPDAGRIAIDDSALFDSAARIDRPAEQRGLGYVFQDFALFPHLTVRQNVAFGLRKGWRNAPLAFASTVVDRWLDTLELRTLADRYPDQISGGQRQRTALARALAPEPRALLLDEPFASLDTSLRERLRAELRELHQRLQLPMLLITHDAADVDAFADDIVHVEHGRAVRAADTPPPDRSPEP